MTKEPNPGPTWDATWPCLSRLPDLTCVRHSGCCHLQPWPATPYQGGGRNKPRQQHFLAEEFKLIYSKYFEITFLKTFPWNCNLNLKKKKCHIERRYQRGSYHEISESKVKDIPHKVKTNLETSETDVLCLLCVLKGLLARKYYCDPRMVIFTELWNKAPAQLSKRGVQTSPVQCICKK